MTILMTILDLATARPRNGAPGVAVVGTRFFAAGYFGHTPDHLLAIAEALDAHIYDIRYSDRSRAPGWNGVNLKRMFGDRYTHVDALGNVNYRGDGPIKIDDLAAGIEILRGCTRPVAILLCGCEEYSCCHRCKVGEALLPAGLMFCGDLEDAAGGTHAWPNVPQPWIYTSIPTISLTQPWASLVAHWEKFWETRDKTFPHRYRGPIAIHASSSFPGEYKDLVRQEPFRSALARHNYYHAHDLPTGAIIAVGEMTDSRPASKDGLSLEEVEFGNYSAGRVMIRLKDMRVLPEPVPYSGALQIWQAYLPTKLLQEIKNGAF